MQGDHSNRWAQSFVVTKPSRSKGLPCGDLRFIGTNRVTKPDYRRGKRQEDSGQRRPGEAVGRGLATLREGGDGFGLWVGDQTLGVRRHTDACWLRKKSDGRLLWQFSLALVSGHRTASV